MVTVDDIEAVCASLDCGFNYVEPEANISDFNLVGTTLTITGSGFTNPIRKITLSNIECTGIQVVDPTSITCEVVPVAGSWKPVVIDSNGLIPIDSTSTIEVELQITSITPNADLNPYGGTYLTIEGNNLPQSITDGTILMIAFEDGTQCTVESTSTTQIVCITEEFASSSVSSSLNVHITVNSLSDLSLSVGISSGPAVISSISPDSVSPVLKTVLTMSVTDFAETLDKSDL